MAEPERGYPEPPLHDRRDELPPEDDAHVNPQNDGDDDEESTERRSAVPTASPLLPELPTSSGGFELDLDSILSPSNPPPTTDKVSKRASSVQKLTMENEKLKAELKAMSDRLEAAERRRKALAQKEQHIMEQPSS